MARAEFSPLPNEQSSMIPSSLPSSGKFTDFVVDQSRINKFLTWNSHSKNESRVLVSNRSGGYYTALCEPALPEH